MCLSSVHCGIAQHVVTAALHVVTDALKLATGAGSTACTGDVPCVTCLFDCKAYGQVSHGRGMLPLQDLRRHLLHLQTQGHELDPVGWPTKMLAQNQR